MISHGEQRLHGILLVTQDQEALLPWRENNLSEHIPETDGVKNTNITSAHRFKSAMDCECDPVDVLERTAWQASLWKQNLET